MKILAVSDLGMASPRILNIARGLAESGHEVYLLTPSMTDKQLDIFGLTQYPDLKILYFKNFKMRYYRHSNYVTRKLFGFCYKLRVHKWTQIGMANLKINDFHMSKISTAIEETLSYVDKLEIEVLLTSSGPIAMHAIGCMVKGRREILWLADYQDLWSLNHNSKKYSELKFQEYEQDLLQSADLILTVSKGFGDQMAQLYSGPITTVYLGYNEGFKEEQESTSPNLVITYTGQVYPNNQRLVDFLDLVILPATHQKNITFVFIGQSSTLVRKYLKKNQLQKPRNLVLKSQVSRKESLEYQQKADLLLLFKWENPEQLGIIPTKFYEYVYSGKPILYYGLVENDEVGSMIKKFNLGIEINSKENLNKFFQSLNRLIVNSLRPSRTPPQTLSYKNQAIKLNDVINKLS